MFNTTPAPISPGFDFAGMGKESIRFATLMDDDDEGWKLYHILKRANTGAMVAIFL